MNGKCELSDTIVISKIDKNKSLASFLWNIGLRFTNNRECGALKAADTLLGIPLYGTDPNTTIRWLDVNQIRYKKVKSYKEIEVLDGDSTDIFYPSVIDDHYIHRPEELESMSLYEFAQLYDIMKIKPQGKNIEYFQMDNGYYKIEFKEDQRRVFDKVTNTIISDKSILRLYVHGEGDTGKSFLIKTIKC